MGDGRMANTIRFEVRPPLRERFLELLNGVLDAMRHEPMFHEAVLHRDPDNAHRFMLCETWEDLDDVVAVQLKRPYREAGHAALPESLAAERDSETWQPVRGDRKGG